MSWRTPEAEKRRATHSAAAHARRQACTARAGPRHWCLRRNSKLPRGYLPPSRSPAYDASHALFTCASGRRASRWRTSPDFSHTVMPTPVPAVLRTTATSFYNEYREQLHMFEDTREVAPGVIVRITGGHTPGHSVVDLVSGDERLTFAGDAMFPVGFDHPDWQNGFEHDPEASTRVRIGLFEELAQNRGLLVASHLPFPSVGRIARNGEAYRWVPVIWDF